MTSAQLARYESKEFTALTNAQNRIAGESYPRDITTITSFMDHEAFLKHVKANTIPSDYR